MGIRVGSIGYASRQGIGWLPKWFYDAGVINEFAIYRHSSRPTHREWYPEGTLELVGRPFNGPKVEEFIKSVDVMLFFETPFDWEFPDLCRKLGVKTAMMPMYEWFPRDPEHRFDLMICPSLLDLDYFKDNWASARCEYLPVPVFTKYWQQRTTATRFLHNCGNVGCREHKGTRQLLEAMRYVETPDLKLTVMTQDMPELGKITRKMGWLKNDKRVTITDRELPYDCLWDREFDVLIAPEKLNGLSLPLQEARAAGMLVMTTDRYPTNTWLPKTGLIPYARTTRENMSGRYLDFDECVVEPKTIAKCIDNIYGTDIYNYSLEGRAWAEANSWDVLAPKYKALLETLK